MHRDTVTRSWDPLLCYSSTTITSMLHDNARSTCCKYLYTIPGSWKHPSFLNGQHTHRTCQPFEHIVMLWIGVYDSVFQFLSIYSNFAQPLKRCGPHSTGHNQQPDHSMQRRCVALREANGSHTRYWWVLDTQTPPNTVKLYILEWPFILDSLSPPIQ